MWKGILHGFSRQGIEVECLYLYIDKICNETDIIEARCNDYIKSDNTQSVFILSSESR
jgi:hypothetical protein